MQFMISVCELKKKREAAEVTLQVSANDFSPDQIAMSICEGGLCSCTVI